MLDSKAAIVYNSFSLPRRKLAGVCYVDQLSRVWAVARAKHGEVKIGENMKYAIVEVGGKQYRCEEGKAITVDLINSSVGDEIVLDKVLLIVDDETATIGKPYIKGASIKTQVQDQIKGKKIFVFKYKPKIRYRRRAGHRQKYTRLLVESIVME